MDERLEWEQIFDGLTRISVGAEALVAERNALVKVAAAAQTLVGAIELGEDEHARLHAASQVNQALSRLDYPVDSEGLIDFDKIVTADEPAR